jgi:hypothetical protein
MRRIVGALVVIVLALFAAEASARPMHFFGPHPVAVKFGGGYCYLDGPHIHIYTPDHMALYHDVGGELVFTADPTPFGYQGPHYSFYGPHPIPGAPGVVYCYIEGPHYHPFPPPAEAPEYRLQGDVAFYIGPFDPVYYRERPHREKQVAVIYRPYVAMRPVVTVAPPPEWHGEVWVAPPAAGVALQAGVYAPAPAAGVSVEIHAPPPPSVHFEVGVGAPPPQTVIVGAPPPAPVYYEDRGAWHHDNGKHKGWYKHGRGDDDDQGEDHGGRRRHHERD